jgi:hypothetical protein
MLNLKIKIMNVSERDLNEMQKALNDFKIISSFLEKEIDKPMLFNMFSAAARLLVLSYKQKADRLFLELYIIVETIKSEKNG